MSTLAEIVSGLGDVQRVTGSANSPTIHFGTTKVKRDKWDGEFPVQIWRVNDMGNDELEEEHRATSRKASTLKRHIRAVGQGWRHGAVKSHVELRNGKREAA